MREDGDVRSDEAREAVESGTPVTARWAYPHDLSSIRGGGRVVAFCDAPQVLIETDEGDQFWWRADLTMLDPTP